LRRNLWIVPKSIEDFRVSQPLLRELRLTNHHELLLTDSGLAAFRQTVKLLDELDPTDGLAGYSDMSSACRRVLEQCLSEGQQPESGQEYVQLIVTELTTRIATYTYIVPMFGVELDGIDGHCPRNTPGGSSIKDADRQPRAAVLAEHLEFIAGADQAVFMG